MIFSEYTLSKSIVDQKAFGDKEKLIWWEGRLDAWSWCKEQLIKERMEKEGLSLKELINPDDSVHPQQR